MLLVLLVFSERREKLVTDRVTDGQTARLQYASWLRLGIMTNELQYAVAPPLGIITLRHGIGGTHHVIQ